MQQEFKVTNDILASSGQRLANFFLDRIVFYAFFGALGVVGLLIAEIVESDKVYAFLDSLEKINRLEDFLYTSAFLFLMYLILESTTQKTIGKFVSTTMVVLENGEKPSANTIAIRTLCRFIPFDIFSYLGKNARGWHDSISKTYVVDIKKFAAKKESILDFEQLGKDQVIF